MTVFNLSQEVYSEFHRLNRYLTYMTILLVCFAALIVWVFSIDIGGKRTTLMGAMFMLLAAFTFKIPYISYRYLRSKYKNHSEKCSILGTDWKLFHDAAMLKR